MGQKPTGPATGFARTVVEVIDEARVARGMTKQELIALSGMPPNTFHTRMRGDRPFDLNDIEKLASALGCSPVLLLREAGGRAGLNDDVAPVTPIRPRYVGGSAEDQEAAFASDIPHEEDHDDYTP